MRWRDPEQQAIRAANLAQHREHRQWLVDLRLAAALAVAFAVMVLMR